MTTSLSFLTIRPKATHTASIIFSHGLGDSGAGWQPVAQHLSSFLPHVKWILPNAPNKPVTINGGMRMPAWYDIKDFGGKIDEMEEDSDGMFESAKNLGEIIKNEIDSGIPSNRIVIGGFSQGSVVSILTALSYSQPLAGVVVLSGYVPLYKTFFDEKLGHIHSANKNIPMFIAHGKEDRVIPFKFSEMSVNAFKNIGKFQDLTVKFYSDMGHESNPQELQDLVLFLKRVLPENKAN